MLYLTILAYITSNMLPNVGIQSMGLQKHTLCQCVQGQ